MADQLGNLVRLARPRHWVKSSFVLIPLVFAKRFLDGRAWLEAGVAFAAFSLAASAAYVFNDIRDRESDRLHPVKRARPLASGSVSVAAASMEAVVLLPASLVLALAVNLPLAVVILTYFGLQVAYSLYLRDRILLDVICIAMGFVLRALAGAVSIRVEISPWLLICTFALCLFMGFCKRYNELATFGEPEAASQHRPLFGEYTTDLLSHLVTLSAGIAIVAFLLYATAGRTVGQFGTPYLAYTLPFVVYGVGRFAMLSMRGTYADPTDLILRDRPFQATIVLWGAAAVGVILCGPQLQKLLSELLP